MSDTRTLKKHYSGGLSKKFWEQVNAVESRGKWPVSELYLLACTLQDLEGRVLQILERKRARR